MNTATVRKAAQERMLDAALMEALTGSAATALPAASPLPSRPLQAWLAAALLLLGSGVAVSVWYLRTAPGAMPARQDVDRLPPAIKVAGAAIADVDGGCANLNWEEVRPPHLQLLSRLPHLRRLRINPDTAPGRTADWQAASAADLQPICALAELEELHLPFCWPLTPAHLQKLGTCRRLSSLSLVNEAVVLDEAVVSELAKWPALRELHLLVLELTGKGLAALARLPQLQDLELWRCRGLDADGIAAVAKSASLRRLRLVGLGRPDPRAGHEDQVAPTWALTPPAMAAIARMPSLEELSLEECELTDAVIGALPDRLRTLGLAHCEVSVPALRGLRRLASLRSLAIGGDGSAPEQDRLDAEFASLLGTLHLEKLDWQGALTPAIVDAVTAQVDLRELGLAWREGTSLDFCARLPRLETLVLTATWRGGSTGRPTTAVQVLQPAGPDLQPLRQCRSLQRVALRGAQAGTPVAGLRAALGPRIAFGLVE